MYDFPGSRTELNVFMSWPKSKVFIDIFFGTPVEFLPMAMGPEKIWNYLWEFHYLKRIGAVLVPAKDLGKNLST